MGRNLIKKTYPAEVNLIMLLCIFIMSCFFSYELFDVRYHNREHLENSYPGMGMIGVAVVLMMLIIWDEILFQVTAKKVEGGMIYRNRMKKLRTQVLLYLPIPAMFTFIYFEYDVKISHFIIWAAICLIVPAVNIIASALNNYNRYLELTNRMIKFQDNNKNGSYNTEDLQNILMVKDKNSVLHKIELSFRNEAPVVIDLDEMHLDAYSKSINRFMKVNYKHLLIEETAARVAS